MAKVIGLGGIFFKSKDPAALAAWYARHLGLELEAWGGARFDEDASRPGYLAWAPFPDDTRYFAPSEQPYMLNFRVDDLAGLLEQLRTDGVEVDERTEQNEYGAFGWVMDPEGTRVELWQPPA
ncbi:VOC family protein [Fulvimonas yonginensis]|uniref:VOC family protein n=1 Tax=Fulvimonas yonginensis TaxID=1495200 RepID=A0ABU8JAN7_9GAMM